MCLGVSFQIGANTFTNLIKAFNKLKLWNKVKIKVHRRIVNHSEETIEEIIGNWLKIREVGEILRLFKPSTFNKNVSIVPTDGVHHLSVMMIIECCFSVVFFEKLHVIWPCRLIQ